MKLKTLNNSKSKLKEMLIDNSNTLKNIGLIKITMRRYNRVPVRFLKLKKIEKVL